jgi:hypothetical protein
VPIWGKTKLVRRSKRERAAPGGAYGVHNHFARLRISTLLATPVAVEQMLVEQGQAGCRGLLQCDVDGAHMAACVLVSGRDDELLGVPARLSAIRCASRFVRDVSLELEQTGEYQCRIISRCPQRK